MKEFRGDTIAFTISGNRTFEKGDKVRVGIKETKTDEEYAVPLKKIDINENQDSLDIVFDYSETETLKPGKYKIEVELTTNSGIRETIIQKDLTIESDVVK